jgi:lysophospholipid acyltransferase (LPLAT)-like uncharacterized protein
MKDISSGDQLVRVVPIAAVCKAARWRLKLASMAVKTEAAIAVAVWHGKRLVKRLAAPQLG